MLRLLTDEDVGGHIVSGLRNRASELGLPLDLQRVVDVELGSTPDPRILEWAAANGRVLLTGDVNTMVQFALERVRNGQPMPGVLALSGSGTISVIVDDVLTIIDCYSEEEMKEMSLVFIPLR